MLVRRQANFENQVYAASPAQPSPVSLPPNRLSSLGAIFTTDPALSAAIWHLSAYLVDPIKQIREVQLAHIRLMPLRHTRFKCGFTPGDAGGALAVVCCLRVGNAVYGDAARRCVKQHLLQVVGLRAGYQLSRFYAYENKYSTALKPSLAAASKRSKNGSPAYIMDKLAANFDVCSGVGDVLQLSLPQPFSPRPHCLFRPGLDHIFVGLLQFASA